MTSFSYDCLAVNKKLYKYKQEQNYSFEYKTQKQAEDHLRSRINSAYKNGFSKVWVPWGPHVETVMKEFQAAGLVHMGYTDDLLYGFVYMDNRSWWRKWRDSRKS